MIPYLSFIHCSASFTVGHSSCIVFTSNHGIVPLKPQLKQWHTAKWLFGLLGGRFGLSRKKDVPRWMKSKAFRYGFLAFFFAMFFLMLWNTYLVFAGAQDLKQVVTLLWTFKLPWNWAYHGTLFHPGVAQFAFGFYSVMLTSTVLGLITMALFKPRSWCVYCPMGTMTQLICKAKNGQTV